MKDIVELILTDDEKIETVQAFDLSFHAADGTQVEPQKAVKVTINVPLADDQEYMLVHIGDDGLAEEVENARFTADGVSFEAADFSVYAIISTVTTVDFLMADGNTVQVTVEFDEEEVIPEGAALEITEVAYDDESYSWRNASLARVLSEQYGNVTISDVRYLDISILADGEEFEPVYPARITITFDEVLNTANTVEYYYDEEDDPTVVPELENRLVAVHYKDNGDVELLDAESVRTEDGIKETTAFTSGFSKYDLAYIYEYDSYEAGTNYDLNAGSLLTANSVTLTASTTSEESSDTSDEDEEAAAETTAEPDHEKTLTDMGDGTYRIGLSVTGDADTETQTAADVNVVIVYDVSNSMTKNYVPLTFGGKGLDTSVGAGAGTDGTYFDLYYMDSNGDYQKAYDGYEGTVYRRTEVTEWNGPHQSTYYTYSEYGDQHYSTSVTRAMAGEKVLYDFTDALFSYQNQDDPTNIQAALVTFSKDADTTQSWTSTETDITNWVSSTGTSTKLGYSEGTNWEGALAEAYSLVSDADSDPTYVVFITDGAPSRTGGGIGTDVTTENNDTADDNYIAALNEAKLVEDACAGKDGAFFGIYAFGKETDWLASLMYYAYQGARPSGDIEGTTFETDGYYNASDADALTSAMSDIFQKIVNTLGVGSATITDGTTSAVTTTSGTIAELLEVNEDSYQYWLSWSVTNNGDGTYSFTMNDTSTGDEITYTVSISGTTVTITWTSGEETKTAAYSGSVSSGNILTVEWTETTDFYNYKPPTAYYDEASSAVIWNLNTLGTLLDDVTYTVTFEVYPSQYTLDLIADLKNGYISYDDLDDNIKAYLIYDEATDSYKLLTNTTATLTYTDTRTTAGEQSADYENPDPVSTGAVTLAALTKNWSNTLLDDDRGKPDSMIMYVTRDGASRYTITLEDPDWYGEVYISYGILTVDTDGNVVIKTEGHNYSFAEPEALEYYWDLVVPTIRPMIINNEETYLVLIEDEEVPDELSSLDSDNGVLTLDEVTYYKLTIGSSVMYYRVEDVEALRLAAENHRRSYLDVTKEASGGLVSADEDFAFSITVVNAKAAKGDANDTDSDYYVWFSIYDADGNIITDKIASGTDIGYEYEEEEFNGYYYIPSGNTITAAMRLGYNLRFLNLPEGSTFSVGETLTEEQTTEGYALVNMVETRSYEETTSVTDDEGNTTTTSEWVTETVNTIPNDEDETTSPITGTIDYAESAYKVTVTNKCVGSFYVYHSSDNTIEKISNDDARFADDGSGTFDLVNETKTGYIYGGYYSSYGGTTATEEYILNDLEYTSTDSDAYTYDSDKTNSNEKWAADDTDGVKPYTYEYGSTDAWTAGNAYSAEAGTSMTPELDKIYYLKEVPDTFLRPVAFRTFKTFTTNLTGCYLTSSVDDANYQTVGFITTIDTGDAEAALYEKVNITWANNATPEDDSLSGTEGDITTEIVMSDVDSTDQFGYIAMADDYTDELTAELVENGSVKMQFLPYFVTPDGIRVTGTKLRQITVTDTYENEEYEITAGDSVIQISEMTFRTYSYGSRIKEVALAGKEFSGLTVLNQEDEDET